MKTYAVTLMAALVAGSLMAQSSAPTSSDPARPLTPTAKTKTEIIISDSHNRSLIGPKLSRPNEIAGRKVVYSGIAVQIIKAREPLQLINPFASPEYGSHEGNLDRDIITGAPVGFKFFSINF